MATLYYCSAIVNITYVASLMYVCSKIPVLGLHLGGQEGAFVPLKTEWPPWAMLCVLLLTLFLKDS